MRVAQRFWTGGRKASPCMIILWSRVDYTIVYHKPRVQPLQATRRCSKFRSRLYIFHSIWQTHGEQCIRVTRFSRSLHVTLGTSDVEMRRLCAEAVTVLKLFTYDLKRSTLGGCRTSVPSGTTTPAWRTRIYSTRGRGFIKKRDAAGRCETLKLFCIENMLRKSKR